MRAQWRYYSVEQTIKECERVTKQGQVVNDNVFERSDDIPSPHKFRSLHVRPTQLIKSNKNTWKFWDAVSLCSKEAQHFDGLRVFTIGFSSFACPFELASLHVCAFAAVLLLSGQQSSAKLIIETNQQ